MINELKSLLSFLFSFNFTHVIHVTKSEMVDHLIRNQKFIESQMSMKQKSNLIEDIVARHFTISIFCAQSVFRQFFWCLESMFCHASNFKCLIDFKSNSPLIYCYWKLMLRLIFDTCVHILTDWSLKEAFRFIIKFFFLPF